MDSKPLVSVIVPTKNSGTFLERCLLSIRAQIYAPIEIIVVDNFSDDNTGEIAHRYADHVFERGPERSAQVNFGVEQAHGEFVYKVDSDFVLEPIVVKECIDESMKGFDAVVVHNSPDTRVSWIARVRKFEVDMYKFDLTFSSARFVRRSVYQSIGGFNSAITAGEDFDFQNKLNRNGYKTGFVEAEALHLGEPKKFIPHLKKYYEYGKDFVHYAAHNQIESATQLSPIRSVYLKRWKDFVEHPALGSAFLVYTACKFCAGGAGYLTVKTFGR